jgi:hypothetical protein
MRYVLSALAGAAFLTFAPAADAMPVGSAVAVQQGAAETGMIEQVRRVCRRNIFTGRVRCWVDRSRPPTVCHRIRGTNRLDCY